MKVIFNDITRCTGCHMCQISCKDEHCGNDWTPYAKPQPDTGHFWGKLNEYERGQTPKVKVARVFIPCQHCTDAPCIASCSYEAITRRDDGLVVIDPELCTGCRLCLYDNACPYGCIYFNDSFNIAQKCTGCAHLIDRGWKYPRCVDICNVDALKFGEESSLDISGAEKLHPEYGTNPNMYYKGLPKRFIAGTVYDPDEKDIIEGATCTLSGDGTGSVTTDSWGDFWFEGLDVGTYSLKVEFNGKSKTIDNISTEKDVRIEDIALS
jgi:Fe-S-cluster-containing dehydrogenase component